MGCCESSYPYTQKFWRANVASAMGDTEKVKKYFQKNKKSFLIHWLFETAVENNQTEVIAYLLSNGVYQGKYADYSLRYLTKDGHAKREKILSTHLATEEEIQTMDVYGFSDVNIPSNYDTKLIKNLVNANYNCHSFNDYLFRMACDQQDLDTIKLIVSLDKAPKNKNILLDIFNLMCCTGNAEVVRILLTLKQRPLLNLHIGLALAIENRKENVARLLLKNKARFGKLNAFSAKQRAFIRYLQRARQVEAANIIRNWWIPICYDMKRECGKRMFEKNYKAYEESFV